MKQHMHTCKVIVSARISVEADAEPGEANI